MCHPDSRPHRNDTTGNRCIIQQQSLNSAFNKKGYISLVFTPARYRMHGDTMRATPYKDRFRDYNKVDGIYIAMRGEVSWVLPEGSCTYWRADITPRTYEYATPIVTSASSDT